MKQVTNSKLFTLFKLTILNPSEISISCVLNVKSFRNYEIFFIFYKIKSLTFDEENSESVVFLRQEETQLNKSTESL